MTLILQLKNHAYIQIRLSIVHKQRNNMSRDAMPISNLFMERLSLQINSWQIYSWKTLQQLNFKQFKPTKATHSDPV